MSPRLGSEGEHRRDVYHGCGRRQAQHSTSEDIDRGRIADERRNGSANEENDRWNWNWSNLRLVISRFEQVSRWQVPTQPSRAQLLG